MIIQLRGGICAGTREAAPSIGLFDPLGGQQAYAGYRLRARTDRQARHLTALITDQHQAQHVARHFPRSHALYRSEEKPAGLAQAVPARCQGPLASTSEQTAVYLPFAALALASASIIRSPAKSQACSDLYPSATTTGLGCPCSQSISIQEVISSPHPSGLQLR